QEGFESSEPWQCTDVRRQACSGMPIQQVALSVPLDLATSCTEDMDNAMISQLSQVSCIAAVRTPYWLCFVGLAQGGDRTRNESGDEADDESAGCGVTASLQPLSAVQTVERIAHVTWSRRQPTIAAFMCEDFSVHVCEFGHTSNHLYSIAGPSLLRHDTHSSVPPVCVHYRTSGDAFVSLAVPCGDKQHLLAAATMRHVLLLDVRRAAQPLLMWQHGMEEEPPQLLTCLPIPDPLFADSPDADEGHMHSSTHDELRRRQFTGLQDRLDATRAGLPNPLSLLGEEHAAFLAASADIGGAVNQADGWDQEAEQRADDIIAVTKQDSTSAWHAQTVDFRLAAQRRRQKRAEGVAAAQAATSVNMTHHWALLAAAVQRASEPDGVVKGSQTRTDLQQQQQMLQQQDVPITMEELASSIEEHQNDYMLGPSQASCGHWGIHGVGDLTSRANQAWPQPARAATGATCVLPSWLRQRSSTDSGPSAGAMPLIKRPQPQIAVASSASMLQNMHQQATPAICDPKHASSPQKAEAAMSSTSIALKQRAVLLNQLTRERHARLLALLFLKIPRAQSEAARVRSVCLRSSPSVRKLL
ncbi:hypothetical protein WJX73_002813, partial [Symbiochloris irregularis]